MTKCDFLDTQSNFISYQSLTNYHSIEIPFTTYEGLKQTIVKLLIRDKTFPINLN